MCFAIRTLLSARGSKSGQLLCRLPVVNNNVPPRRGNPGLYIGLPTYFHAQSSRFLHYFLQHADPWTYAPGKDYNLILTTTQNSVVDHVSYNVSTEYTVTERLLTNGDMDMR